jgi:methionine synthase I (cobalamin-dependent)
MNLAAFLKNQETILLDGAMGTQLDKYGLIAHGANNIAAPEVVLEIHREYVECNSNASTTTLFVAMTIIGKAEQTVNSAF